MDSRRLYSCLDQIRKHTDFRPVIGLTLGSGLNGFGDRIQCECIIPYRDIEGMPISTVAGHKGCYLFGTLDGVPIVAMQGRVHYYEGITSEEAVLPVRLMGLLGAGTIILTNACGGIREDLKPGSLMCITDHILYNVPSPLIGPNEDRLGVRFPDMSHVYDPELIRILHSAAEHSGVELKDGVYMQFSGPQYETPAEVRMARAVGADACGMSTAIEAIAASHMGLHVCGISCITNRAAGLSEVPLTHEEVSKAADRASAAFSSLVRQAVTEIAQSLQKNGK